MTGKQLKNSILQLAIQGKLVPQDPHDEPASELLKRIRKEKEQLVKDGKLKKKDLVSEPIADEDKPFEIPEGWEWCRLSTIVNILGDGIHGTPTYSENGDYYFVNGNNLCQGKILIKPDTKKCSSAEFEKYKKNLNSSTMFVSINGTIGNYAFYKNEPIILGKSACYFNLSEAKLKDYLAHFVQTKYFLEYALDNATGSTIKNVSLGTMRETLIPLPPLPEQHRIVAKIEELMPLVEEYDKAQTQLDALNASLPEALKKSILQQAIQGKLVPQDPNDEPASVLLKRIRKEKEQLVKDGKLKKKDLVSEPIADEDKPFEIPEGWEWCRWGELSFNIQYGYNAPALPSGDIRMVRISDIQNGNVSWDTVPFCNIKEEDINSYLLGNNDILFARTGGTVGKSFLVKEVPYPSIYAGYLIRTQYDSNLLVPEYLKLFMESDIYWRQLKDGTIATAQPNCNGKTLSKMVLPIPPLPEQHRIVAKIEELFAALK